MSLFQTTEQNQNTDPNAVPSNQEGWLKKIVEAKGEQWSNPEILAKGKLEADAYVKQLETQLNELRDELGKQDYAKDLLTQLQNKALNPTNGNPVVPNNNNGGAETSQTKAALSDEQLKALVDNALTEREKQNTVKQNLSVVEQELSSKYGTEAEALIAKKAQELGMTVDRLGSIAAESPTAFFALIGEQRKDFPSMINGTIKTEGVNMQASAERNFKFYQEFRKKNRKQYFAPATQQAMFKDRQRLGDKFYL